jgi:hypothetical protein
MPTVTPLLLIRQKSCRLDAGATWSFDAITKLTSNYLSYSWED